MVIAQLRHLHFNFFVCCFAFFCSVYSFFMHVVIFSFNFFLSLCYLYGFFYFFTKCKFLFCCHVVAMKYKIDVFVKNNLH